MTLDYTGDTDRRQSMKVGTNIGQVKSNVVTLKRQYQTPELSQLKESSGVRYKTNQDI